MSSAGFGVPNSSGGYAFLVDQDGNTTVGDEASDVFQLTGSAYIAGPLVINDASADVDLRVESNNNENMLVVDAGNDRVGIGTGTPAEALEVAGNLKISGDDPRIKIDGVTDSHPGLEFYENGTRKWIIFNNYGDDSLDFKTNSNTRMVINQDGTVGIGTQSPSTTLDVNGSANISGQFARGVASVNLGSGTTSTLNPGTSGAGTLLVTASSITTPTSAPNEMMHICSLADGTIAGQVLTIIIVSDFLAGASGPADMGVLLITPNTPLNSSTGIVTFTGSGGGGNPIGSTAVLMWTGSAWAVLSTRRGGGNA